MEYTTSMVQLLRERVTGVTVSGPRDDLPIAPAPLEPTCIVQAVPGPPDLGNQIRVVGYTLRVYAMTNDLVLAAWDEIDDAFYEPLGDPITGLMIGSKWMLSASLGTPGGPTKDPVAKWPVLVGNAQVDWAARELGVG